MTTGLCPTCHIGMAPYTGPGGLLWRCEDCGHEDVRRVVARGRDWGAKGEDMAGLTGVMNSNGVAAPARATEARTWDEMARQRLDVVLRGITAVEELQREAAGIHAALTAYGVTALPPLSWVPPRAGKPAPPRGMRTSDVSQHERDQYRTPACIVCGYTFQHSVDSTITRAGSVCRSEKRCDERKAAAAAIEATP